MVDATQIERYVSGKSHVDFDLRRADVNIDGIVDIYDAYLIQAVLSGKIDGLPHECRINIKGYEMIDEEKHNKVAECQCGDFLIENSEPHDFVDGKCVCGAEEKIIYGDVNVDGKVNNRDWKLISDVLNGKMSNELNDKNADVDLSGNITENDLWLMKLYLSEILKELPHNCTSHTTKYENVDGEKHQIIEECECGEISIENSESHDFVDGKCECGATEE